MLGKSCTMPSSLERNLRIGTLICSIGAIAILIPATVESFNVLSGYYCRYSCRSDSFLVFGFIPLFFTILSSAVYFALQRYSKNRDVAKSHPLFFVTADFLIFAGYMIALVFEWVRGPERLDYSPKIAFLEAYATVPLMVNMYDYLPPLGSIVANCDRLIHMVAFFANSKAAFHSLVAKKWTATSECPHCHHRIGARTEEVVQKGTGEGYSLLRGEEYDEDAGRASEDLADRATVGEA
jgi:hypothetical protein